MIIDLFAIQLHIMFRLFQSKMYEKDNNSPKSIKCLSSNIGLFNSIKLSDVSLLVTQTENFINRTKKF